MSKIRKNLGGFIFASHFEKFRMDKFSRFDDSKRFRHTKERKLAKTRKFTLRKFIRLKYIFV